MSGAVLKHAAAVALLTLAVPAHAAMYVSEREGAMTLTGFFERGDELRFAELLARPRTTKLKVVYLDSFGGAVVPGILIGRMIRKAGLATAVDARSARCDSACTLVFAGGVRRHYVAGESVFEGGSGGSGLGFHPAHTRDPAWTRAELSDKATAWMIAHYRQMGAPQAAELMRRAGFSNIFRPSGATALRVRIATTLAAPAH